MIKAKCNCVGALLLLLSGCGGDSTPGGGSSPTPTPTPPPTIMVTVSGLRVGQQVTFANGTDQVTATMSGSFTFSQPVPLNGGYTVTIAAQPSAETCVLTDATGIVASAATITVKASCGITTLYTFSRRGPEGQGGSGGFNNFLDLMITSDGAIYGTAVNGGFIDPAATLLGRPLDVDGMGTIFKMTPTGVVTALHAFLGDADGKHPQGPPVEGPGGDLYGTTVTGGAGNVGTIFKISRSGIFTLLHSFRIDVTNPTPGTGQGYLPIGALLLDQGELYGMTGRGGQFDSGTIYKLTASGNVVILYSFDPAQLVNPTGALVKGSNGSFYGIAGSNLFKMAPDNNVTIVHNFGTAPLTGNLILDTSGNIYGTSWGPPMRGVVFKLSPSGTYTVLHQFTGDDGAYPTGGLTWGLDGNIYGMTVGIGSGIPAPGWTIFRITTTGDFTSLYASPFTDDRAPTGLLPLAALIQDPAGIFYGTTSKGGTNAVGTIFKF
jgi:uncharacterized repeat protein (TIGR03803 family)